MNDMKRFDRHAKLSSWRRSNGACEWSSTGSKSTCKDLNKYMDLDPCTVGGLNNIVHTQSQRRDLYI